MDDDIGPPRSAGSPLLAEYKSRRRFVLAFAAAHTKTQHKNETLVLRQPRHTTRTYDTTGRSKKAVPPWRTSWTRATTAAKARSKEKSSWPSTACIMRQPRRARTVFTYLSLPFGVGQVGVVYSLRLLLHRRWGPDGRDNYGTAVT